MSRYHKTFTVRWADCDMNGHMRNTSYSEFTIDVRVAFLAEHGVGFEVLKRSGFGPVILREEIDYLRELHMGEEVVVDLEALGLSADHSRWRVRHTLTGAHGKTAARVVLDGGWMDLSKRKLAPPPDPLGSVWSKAPRAAEFAEIPTRRK